MDQTKVEYIWNAMLRRIYRLQNVEPRTGESLFGVCDLEFSGNVWRVKRFGKEARNDIEIDDIRNPVSLTKSTCHVMQNERKTYFVSLPEVRRDVAAVRPGFVG